MDMAQYFATEGWAIARDTIEPEKPPVFISPKGLALSRASRQVLDAPAYSAGIYEHQYRAVEAFKGGADLCLSTSTASGKSLVFNLCALELLCKETKGTVLALYPLRALTDEQESKWRIVAEASGTRLNVGRIDGSVKQRDRPALVAQSSVLVATPDIIHTWLLYHASNKYVKNFLSNLQLIVVDEAHTYSGVFGSNSAYLLRRLQYLCQKLNANPRYIAASATMLGPEKHLGLLTGKDFHVIDQSMDTSGRRERRLLLVEPPHGKDNLVALTDLMRFTVAETAHQFITFVDSRRSTEQLATVMRRTSGNDGDEEVEALDPDGLVSMKVYPFRAGYEAADRKKIQGKLQRNEVRGVISTSALEMGIDIRSLTLGILAGVPTSATSYYQRIGRIGRRAKGTIVVVRSDSVLSRRVFARPDVIDSLPLSETALYLENKNVQYIHAMCLARRGGEHFAVTGDDYSSVNSLAPDTFPESFADLCVNESVGEIERELQPMKAAAGNDPNHTFFLRDCEVQFKVEQEGSATGPARSLGELSFSQVMREAYPGAIYYYMSQPYRVTRILMRQHTIKVRREKYYTTKPTAIPTLIYPNLTDGNVHSTMALGQLKLIECNVQVNNTITGFRERRGPNQFPQSYPLDPALGFFFDQPRFERNFFSTGVLLLHPGMSGAAINRQLLAKTLFEGFLMEVPFERQDMDASADRFRSSRVPGFESEAFVCVYDQTYGSLRLNRRLMNVTTLRGVLAKALDIARSELVEPILDEQVNQETVAFLEELVDESGSHPEPFTLHVGDDESFPNAIEVILPGSVGLNPDYGNEEFRVEDVRFTPKGLLYRGKRLSQQGARFEEVSVSVPADRIVPIPGRSALGYYDPDSDSIVAAAK